MLSAKHKEIWPVMLTPFHQDGSVDYESLEGLIEWYIDGGSDGLFAVCQSSEMFYLSLQEKVDIASFVCRKVNGRVPVVASGHTECSVGKQTEEIKAMADTGVNAVILITNRFDDQQTPSDGDFMQELDRVIDSIPDSIRLGMYECPYPFK